MSGQGGEREAGCSCQPDHRVVYEKGLEAVCSCGAVLSVYGLTRSIASVFSQHLRDVATTPTASDWGQS